VERVGRRDSQWDELRYDEKLELAVIDAFESLSAQVVVA